MVIGVILFVLAILAVFIGTRDSEAQVLYYDAEYEQVDNAEQEEAAEDQSDDFIQDGLGGQQSVISEQEKPSPRMSVTVGGTEVKRRPSAGATDSLDDIRQAAAANDPNATAQALFDQMKEGKW